MKSPSIIKVLAIWLQDRRGVQGWEAKGTRVKGMQNLTLTLTLHTLTLDPQGFGLPSLFPTTRRDMPRVNQLHVSTTQNAKSIEIVPGVERIPMSGSMKYFSNDSRAVESEEENSESSSSIKSCIIQVICSGVDMNISFTTYLNLVVRLSQQLLPLV